MGAQDSGQKPPRLPGLAVQPVGEQDGLIAQLPGRLGVCKAVHGQTLEQVQVLAADEAVILQLHVHGHRVALVGPDFGAALIEGVPLFVVLPDDALQNGHVDLPPGTVHPGQQLVHVRPAVLVQGNPSLLGPVPQHQT